MGLKNLGSAYVKVKVSVTPMSRSIFLIELFIYAGFLVRAASQDNSTVFLLCVWVIFLFIHALINALNSFFSFLQL